MLISDTLILLAGFRGELGSSSGPVISPGGNSGGASPEPATGVCGGSGDVFLTTPMGVPTFCCFLYVLGVWVAAIAVAVARANALAKAFPPAASKLPSLLGVDLKRKKVGRSSE